jgi:hypothetical protein
LTPKMCSLCTAACVHVHARSIKACFSCSVLDLRAQRTASSAYCRNPSAFDIATLLTTPPSCRACARCQRQSEQNCSLGCRQLSREGHDISAEQVRELALGYGALEGLMVTPFSVPTSTFPAFWCPGIREVNPIAGGPAITFPWVPLFIRTNMLQHLVLG